MKKFTNFKSFVLAFTLVFFTSINVWGQTALPLYEAIDYTSGVGLQTQTGWTALNTGDDLLISTGSLSYSGLQESAGNKVTFDGLGIDAVTTYTDQLTGTVYASFLLNVTALGTLDATNGGYFSGLAESTTLFGAAIWTRLSGAGYNIGLSPRTSTSSIAWSPDAYSLNSTVLVVIAYEIVDGTANDIVKMWINPTPGAVEPAATLTATNTGGTDLTKLTRFLIRQDSATETPSIEMDEIRIATSWAEVTPEAGAVVVPQANITSFSIAEQSGSSIINTSAGTIAIEVANGTSLTALVPTITVSDGATVSPETGVAQDFTNPVVYTVTASDLTTKDWTVTVTEAAPIVTTPIYDIQYSTVAPYDSPLNTQSVTISGVVTAVLTSGYYVQDAVGAWNGVLVYETTNKPAIGDNVTVTGVVKEYNNLTEISPVTAYTKNSSGNSMAASIISSLDAATEAYEGVLVTVDNAQCTAVPDAYGVWTIDDGSGAVFVDDVLYAFVPALNSYYKVTGPVNYAYSQFKITPRTAADVDFASAIEVSVNNKLNVYPNPVVNTLHIDNVSEYSRIEVSNLLGQAIAKFENNKVNANIDFSKLNKGIYFVSLYTKDGLVKTMKITKK